MFHTRLKLSTRIHRKLFTYPALRPAMKFAAGMHAAHGLAHGVPASATSPARR